MIKKIKIRVKADKTNITLPAIPISLFRFGVKSVLRFCGTKHETKTDNENELINLSIENKLSGNENIEIYDNGDYQVFDENGEPIKDNSSLDDNQDFVKIMEFADKFLKESRDVLKDLEPFTLVEVHAEDVYVLIEMR